MVQAWDMDQQQWYLNKLEFSFIVEWLSGCQWLSVHACSVLRGTCNVKQMMRQPLPMGQLCGACLPRDVLESAVVLLGASQLV